MKTVKKALASVLVLYLLLSIVSGCTSGQDELYSQVMTEGGESSIKPEISSVISKEEPSENRNDLEYTIEEDRYDSQMNYLEKRPTGDEMFDIEPDLSLSGELTISVVYLEERLVRWTEAFEAAHPNVKITINAGFDSDAAAEAAVAAGKSYQDVNRQQIVDLFSGEAGDIVDLYLSPYRRYYQSGLFYDLHEFMDSDPEFREEDYYTGILKAWVMEDGALPVLGTCVNPTAFAFNTLVLDEMGINLKKEYPGGMNYEEIADLFYRARDCGALTKDAVLGKCIDPASFNQCEILNYIDETQGTAHLDDPKYVKYLKTMKELPHEGQSFVHADSQYSFEDRTELVQHSFVQFATVDRLAYGAEKDNLVYQTYRIRKGGSLFFGRDMFGITKSCTNPQLAWEFVKFVSSDKNVPEQLTLGGQNDAIYYEQYALGFPINRVNLKKLCDSYFNKDEAVYQAANRLMENLDVAEFQDGELLSPLEEIHKNYFDRDLITAEECAKQLQERAWIYFNE